MPARRRFSVQITDANRVSQLVFSFPASRKDLDAYFAARRAPPSTTFRLLRRRGFVVTREGPRCRVGDALCSLAELRAKLPASAGYLSTCWRPFVVSMACVPPGWTIRKPATSAARTARSMSRAARIPARAAQTPMRSNWPGHPQVAA